MTNRLKVLYIAGWGRSGSTILQNMLGEIEGFQPLGELYSIGRRYLSIFQSKNEPEIGPGGKGQAAG